MPFAPLLLALAQAPVAPRVHSISDISQEFTSTWTGASTPST